MTLDVVTSVASTFFKNSMGCRMGSLIVGYTPARPASSFIIRVLKSKILNSLVDVSGGGKYREPYTGG